MKNIIKADSENDISKKVSKTGFQFHIFQMIFPITSRAHNEFDV